MMKISRQIICSFILLFFLVTVAETLVGTALASDVNLEQVGHFGGSPSVVDVVGNYACVGLGDNFLILDISNTSSPVELGKIDVNSNVDDIEISSNYAYVTGFNIGLVIVDISNPSSPTITGKLGNYGDLGGDSFVSISGNYAYIANDNKGIVIVDVSDPSSPNLKGICSTSNNIYDISVSGKYVFAAGSKGLEVVDVSNPSSPTLAGSYITGGSAQSISVSGNYAYIADTSKGLVIVDVSNPSSPTLAGNYSTDGVALDVSISGNYAYVANQFKGLSIIDIVNPHIPILKGSYSTNEFASGVSVSGNYAYLVIPLEGLEIVDVVNPSSPTTKGIYITSSFAESVSVSDNYAYVADVVNGLMIFDINSPSYPLFKGRENTLGEASDVSVSGKYAYVAAGSKGLGIIDISSPSSPVLIGKYRTGGNAVGISVSSNYAYIAAGSKGLAIIDISNPSSPTLAGVCSTGGNALDVSVSGNYAYVVDYSKGLLIIDIKDPYSPNILGSYDTAGYSCDVSVSGNYAYVADGDNGLSIIDISNVTHPVIAGIYDTLRNSYAVSVSGNYAYVDDDFYLEIVDISNPSSPVLKGNYRTGGLAKGISVSGNYVYVANNGNGLVILKTDLQNQVPAEGSLVQIEGSPDIYLIENGMKRHFTSPEALLWNGHSFDEVTYVTSETLQKYPNGNDISISQAIIDKYNSLGGAPIFGASDGKGENIGDKDSEGTYCSYVNFEKGSLECFVNGPNVGKTYAIFNPFFTKWASMGYAKSVLGYPIDNMSDEQTSKFGTQFRYQNFANGNENGALEYNIDSGDVFAIHGAIFAKWGALGYANSNLGLVTSDERDAVPSFKGTTGRVSDFENGHLHWHSSGEHYMTTYMTYGDLDKLYVSMGGTASSLGFPIMDQKEDGKEHDYCEFEGGYIKWNGNEYSTHIYGRQMIQGRIEYTEAGNLLPLKYAKIEIDVDHDPNNGILASSNTVQDGSFNVEIDDQTESDLLYMRVYADSEGSEKDKVSVSLDGGNIIYYPTNISKSSINNVKIPEYAAIQIYGHMLNTYDFYANYLDLNKINVALNNSVPTGEYNYIENKIIINPIHYLKTNDNIELYHEYGHFVMDTPHETFGLMPKLNRPKDVISEGDNNIIPWIEGWAIFCSAAVNGDATVASIGDLSIINLETARSGVSYAPHSNKNMLRNSAFLWDIYDGRGDLDETYDHFDGQNDISPIIDILKSSKTYIYYVDDPDEPIYIHATPWNVKDFYDGWVSNGKPQINELNELVKHHFNAYWDLKVYSPVNLHLYDSKGNHIGGNETTGGIDREIMGSYYSGPDSHPQEIFVICDNNDNQTSCVIEGKEEGTFTLEFENAGNGKIVNTTYENIPVKKGSLGYLGTNIEDEQHLLKMDINGDGVIDELISPTYIKIDESDNYSPSSITNLQSTNGTTWLNWTWTNPSDADFNHTEIYLDGIFQINTSAEYFNVTGLQPETSYTLSTRTVDNNRNVNEMWVNSTATTSGKVLSDVEKPVIQSAILFPANTTASSKININVNATDNIEVAEVKAGDIQLLKDNNGDWQGTITAPSSVGTYSLPIKANDTYGNIVVTSVPYRVVQLSGGPVIGVSPRSSSVAAGNTVPLIIKVKNMQNTDDTFKVRISVSELPASYQANLAWFDWTEKVVTLRSGQEVQIPIKVNLPAGTAKGSKLFRANVNSQTSTLKGFDTGYLTVK